MMMKRHPDPPNAPPPSDTAGYPFCILADQLTPRTYYFAQVGDRLSVDDEWYDIPSRLWRLGAECYARSPIDYAPYPPGYILCAGDRLIYRRRCLYRVVTEKYDARVGTSRCDVSGHRSFSEAKAAADDLRAAGWRRPICVIDDVPDPEPRDLYSLAGAPLR